MAALPISDLLAEVDYFRVASDQLRRNSTTSRLEPRLGQPIPGKEPLGQQICTSWPFMNNLVYRDGRDLGRGW